MEQDLRLIPVGQVRSPFRSTAEAPRQGRESGSEAVIEVNPEFREGLKGIERWEHLLVICWLHQADRETLKVHPRGDAASTKAGVFATRSPARPNPVAVYTVELLEVRPDSLLVRGIDALDGTPVVDLRPHIPRLDD